MIKLPSASVAAYGKASLGAEVTVAMSALAKPAFAHHQQAANFNCPPESQQQNILAERWGLVERNGNDFKAKYGLPAELPDPSNRYAPWKAFAPEPFDPSRHFMKPGGYLADRVA